MREFLVACFKRNVIVLLRSLCNNAARFSHLSLDKLEFKFYVSNIVIINLCLSL